MDFLDLAKFVISIGGLSTLLFIYTGYIFNFLYKDYVLPNYMAIISEKAFGFILFCFQAFNIYFVFAKKDPASLAESNYFNSYFAILLILFYYVIITILYIIIKNGGVVSKNSFFNIIIKSINNFIVFCVILFTLSFISALSIYCLFFEHFINMQDFLSFSKSITIYFTYMTDCFFIYSLTVLICGGAYAIIRLNRLSYYIIKSHTTDLGELIPDLKQYSYLTNILYEDKEYIYLLTLGRGKPVIRKDLVSIKMHVTNQEAHELLENQNRSKV